MCAGVTSAPGGGTSGGARTERKVLLGRGEAWRGEVQWEEGWEGKTGRRGRSSTGVLQTRLFRVLGTAEGQTGKVD